MESGSFNIWVWSTYVHITEFIAKEKDGDLKIRKNIAKNRIRVEVLWLDRCSGCRPARINPDKI